MSAFRGKLLILFNFIGWSHSRTNTLSNEYNCPNQIRNIIMDSTKRTLKKDYMEVRNIILENASACIYIHTFCFSIALYYGWATSKHVKNSQIEYLRHATICETLNKYKTKMANNVELVISILIDFGITFWFHYSM